MTAGWMLISPGAWPQTVKGLRCVNMAEIVLRVRLIGGEHLDVTYERAGESDEVLEHVISVMAAGDSALRCKHGGRLIVLFSRGVATLEAAPRGAVL